MANGIMAREQSDWREREKAEAAAKAAKKVKRVSAERASNGGFIIQHHFDNSGPGPYRESEDIPFGPEDGEKVISHLREHLGVKKAAAKPKPAAGGNDYDDDDKEY